VRRVFIDTSAYVALTDRSDQFHAAAVESLQRLLDLHLSQVTTNLVLAETYTCIRRKLGHAAAVRFGAGIHRLRVTPEFRVVYIDATLDEEAWRIFSRYADQDFSYVDCTSFAWLRRHSEVEVFAFDDDFAWMGFTPFSGS